MRPYLAAGLPLSCAIVILKRAKTAERGNEQALFNIVEGGFVKHVPSSFGEEFKIASYRSPVRTGALVAAPRIQPEVTLFRAHKAYCV